MKQTEQFGLSQWELTDLVRMDDFNADNAKIDAALAGLSSRLDAAGDSSALSAKLGRTEIIRQVSSPGPISGSNVQPKLNWNEWDTVGVLFYPDISQCSEDDLVRFCVFGGTGGSQISEVHFAAGPYMALLFPWHDENRLAQGVVIGTGTSMLKASFTFKTIDSLNFVISSDQNHKFSSLEFTFFGLR